MFRDSHPLLSLIFLPYFHLLAIPTSHGITYLATTIKHNSFPTMLTDSQGGITSSPQERGTQSGNAITSSGSVGETSQSASGVNSTLLLGVSLVILTGLIGSVSVIVFWQVKRANIKKAKDRVRLANLTGDTEMGEQAMHYNV